MSEHLDQLRQLASTYVTEDEPILGAIKVMYGGKINLNQPPRGLEKLGQGEAVQAGQELAERRAAQPSVEFPTAKQMALVLTGSRLLVWSTGGLKGKPKAFIGEVPLAGIERMEMSEGRLNAQYTLRLASGWEVTLDADRGDAGTQFGTQLKELVEREEPSTF
jgi:hypothetical protein